MTIWFYAWVNFGWWSNYPKIWYENNHLATFTKVEQPKSLIHSVVSCEWQATSLSEKLLLMQSLITRKICKSCWPTRLYRQRLYFVEEEAQFSSVTLNNLFSKGFLNFDGFTRQTSITLTRGSKWRFHCVQRPPPLGPQHSGRYRQVVVVQRSFKFVPTKANVIVSKFALNSLLVNNFDSDYTIIDALNESNELTRN